MSIKALGAGGVFLDFFHVFLTICCHFFLVSWNVCIDSLFIWAWFLKCFFFLCAYDGGLDFFPSLTGIQEWIQLCTPDDFGFIRTSTVGSAVRNAHQCYLPNCVSNGECTWEALSNHGTQHLWPSSWCNEICEIYNLCDNFTWSGTNTFPCFSDTW